TERTNLGTLTCAEGVSPLPPPATKVTVGDESRIGQCSFTDDPREEGMSRGRFESPVGRTTRYGKSFRQSPLLQTSNQPLPQRNHGRGQIDDHAASFPGDPPARLEHRLLKPPQVPAGPGPIFQLAPQHVRQVKRQERQQQRGFIRLELL